MLIEIAVSILSQTANVSATSSIELLVTLPVQQLPSVTYVQSVVAGTNVTVDSSDPQNPIVNSSGGGGGSASWGSISGTLANQTDLATALNAKFNSPSGSTAQYLRGDGSLATFPTNNTAFSNGAGYITGISSGDVVTALGYTPYNATNPNNYITASSSNTLTNKGGNISMWTNNAGYITGISSGDVTSALGFTPYNATNPSGFISGNQSISISGDATGSGTTSITLALATVNSNIGTFNNVTVNGKGLVTAASNVSYLTAAITSLNGLTGATQTFTNDTNVTIISSGTAHAITWSGTLADGRIASASTWNAKQSAITTGTSSQYFKGDLSLGTLPVTTIDATTTDATVTGTVTETILYSKQIAANTFAAGDVIYLNWRVRKTGTAGIATFKIYVNSSAAIAGATQIATIQLSGATNIYGAGARMISCKASNTLETYSTTTATYSDITQTTVAASTPAYTYANAYYWFITCTLGNTGDTGIFSTWEIRRNRV